MERGTRVKRIEHGRDGRGEVKKWRNRGIAENLAANGVQSTERNFSGTFDLGDLFLDGSRWNVELIEIGLIFISFLNRQFRVKHWKVLFS